MSYSELMGLASPYAHMLRDLHGALEVSCGVAVRWWRGSYAVVGRSG